MDDAYIASAHANKLVPSKLDAGPHNYHFNGHQEFVACNPYYRSEILQKIQKKPYRKYQYFVHLIPNGLAKFHFTAVDNNLNYIAIFFIRVFL